MAAGGSSYSVAVVCSPGAPQSDKGMPGFSRHATGRGKENGGTERKKLERRKE